MGEFCQQVIALEGAAKAENTIDKNEPVARKFSLNSITQIIV